MVGPLERVDGVFVAPELEVEAPEDVGEARVFGDERRRAGEGLLREIAPAQSLSARAEREERIGIVEVSGASCKARRRAIGAGPISLKPPSTRKVFIRSATP